MIRINNIRIEKLDNTSRLCADVIYKNKKQTLWYEVDSVYEQCLCYERADAFLDALLLFAMEHKEDVKIEGTAISSKLYFNVVNYIIPAISKLGGKYSRIKVIADVSSDKLVNLDYNGMGISRGVDSFSTLKEHSEICSDDLKINCLTFFNVGSHRDFGGEEARNLFKKRMLLSQKFALENDYKFIWVDSNISEFLKQIFVETHTFRSTSAVFAIQKAFRNYYYSSGFSIYEFKVVENIPAKFDVFSLSMLSNDNVNFYSSGCLYNRLEKVESIIDYKLARQNLNVCFKDEINCGKCEKCVRTMFELYALNGLEKYEKVFDISEFDLHQNWYQRKFMEGYYSKKSDYRDAYKKMKENNKKIKLRNKLIGFVIYEVKKVLPSKVIEMLKK